MSRHIPITVLSGYLGSGKTTIINNVLAEARGTRLAVVVNDFGPVNVDARLIRTEGATAVELTNGCVCCSIGDDLGATLSAIAAWDMPPERVLLEASGIAEPARIAAIAGNWPGYELDAVIVAADSETVCVRARDKFVGQLVLSQLRSADIVALTKTDLLDAGQVETVRRWLLHSDPRANIVAAPNGRLPAGLLFGLGADRSERARPFEEHHHLHFASACWRPDGPVDAARLRDCLAALPAHVHRVKGIVTDGATGAGLLVQCAGKRCEMTSIAPTMEPGLVLISTGSQAQLDEACRLLRDSCLA